jgi:Transposase
MKKSKFTEQQIALILKQADDGVSVEDTRRKAGISIQTYYRLRQKYGGLGSTASCWTTRGRASRPTRPLPKASAAPSGRNGWTHFGS